MKKAEIEKLKAEAKEAKRAAKYHEKEREFEIELNNELRGEVAMALNAKTEAEEKFAAYKKDMESTNEGFVKIRDAREKELSGRVAELEQALIDSRKSALDQRLYRATVSGLLLNVYNHCLRENTPNSLKAIIGTYLGFDSKHEMEGYVFTMGDPENGVRIDSAVVKKDTLELAG